MVSITTQQKFEGLQRCLERNRACFKDEEAFSHFVSDFVDTLALMYRSFDSEQFLEYVDLNVKRRVTIAAILRGDDASI